MSATYLHSGAHGDVVYSLPAIKADGGGTVLLAKAALFATLAPLLDAQPYVHETVLYDGRPYDCRLDAFRRRAMRRPSRLLTACHLDVVRKRCDLSTAWLENIGTKQVAELVVSCTPRYHDTEEIPWRLLADYRDKIAFIGYDADWRYFCKKADFAPARHPIGDAQEFARVIKGSRLFLGNQSLGFAIAEGLKHPRVLEVYRKMPNCMPQGPHGYTSLSHELLEQRLTERNVSPTCRATER